MNSTPSYTRADIVRWLGQREVLKGQLYLDAVSRLDIQPEHVSALVKGSMLFPYEVEIDFFTDRAGKKEIDTLCSCPVAHDCKHIAATLLAVLEPQAKPNRVNPEVLKWLESFRRAVSAGQKNKTDKAAKTAEC